MRLAGVEVADNGNPEDEGDSGVNSSALIGDTGVRGFSGEALGVVVPLGEVLVGDS